VASAWPTYTGRSLLAFAFLHQGARVTPEDYMRRRRVAGWLVLKDGAIVTERYDMGNVPSSRWASFSVAKSFTSTLVGAALYDGSLDSLDRRCETLVPALAGSAFAGTTVRHLLRMTSGVRWNEDYTSATSDIALFSQALAQRRAGAVLDLLRTRPREAIAGTRFNYSTADTFVLGAIVTAATGMSLSGYLSAKIWSRLGADADAYWMVEAPDGQELAGGALCATLRDYARFGHFVMQDGVVGGQRVLPVGWRDIASRPDTAVTAAQGYGYQWWTLDGGAAFTGRGIYGQFLYVHPQERVVSVVLSAWPQALDGAADAETVSLFSGTVDWLR
jgi:CubicO group peptidase (beta-lactamase class C family)